MLCVVLCAVVLPSLRCVVLLLEVLVCQCLCVVCSLLLYVYCYYCCCCCCCGCEGASYMCVVMHCYRLCFIPITLYTDDILPLLLKSLDPKGLAEEGYCVVWL